jgi:hypothetical protein
LGIAVCLLCRTYLLVSRRIEAKQEMDNYVRDKLHFLQDLRNIPALKDLSSYPLRAKEFLEKKLTLVAAVASIYHELREDCIKYRFPHVGSIRFTRTTSNWCSGVSR